MVANAHLFYLFVVPAGYICLFMSEFWRRGGTTSVYLNAVGFRKGVWSFEIDRI